MEIKTVSLIGLGALGVLFGQQMAAHMPEGDLRIIADRNRIARYGREGVFCNGAPCAFHYVAPEEPCVPADLLLFSVKYNGLEEAIRMAEGHVGEHTVILSLLNGISSEERLGEAYGPEKVLCCVAQGMDAVKVGGRLSYRHMGMLCFGDKETGPASEQVLAVSRFFEKTGVPHEVDPDMRKRLWGKFMFNVGVNQTAAVYGGDYGLLQREGPARDTMLAAMREVIVLSGLEGVSLTEEDLTQYWMKVLDGLSPAGKPSMRQDAEAGRPSEVELFSGTVLTLGEKHGLSVPVSRMLYGRIREMERAYE